MINAVNITARTPTEIEALWDILKQLVITENAGRKRQIISIPPSVLETNKNYVLDDGTVIKGVRNSDNVRIFRHYLTKRIEGMKNLKNRLSSNRIRFNTLFKECDIETDNREVLRQHRDNIKNLLEYWVAIRYIGGFEFIKEGNQFKSIEIELSTQPLLTR